jgi:hypothetical protein
MSDRLVTPEDWERAGRELAESSRREQGLPSKIQNADFYEYVGICLKDLRNNGVA